MVSRTISRTAGATGRRLARRQSVGWRDVPEDEGSAGLGEAGAAANAAVDPALASAAAAFSSSFTAPVSSVADDAAVFKTPRPRRRPSSSAAGVLDGVVGVIAGASSVTPAPTRRRAATESRPAPSSSSSSYSSEASSESPSVSALAPLAADAIAAGMSPARRRKSFRRPSASAIASVAINDDDDDGAPVPVATVVRPRSPQLAHDALAELSSATAPLLEEVDGTGFNNSSISSGGAAVAVAAALPRPLVHYAPAAPSASASLQTGVGAAMAQPPALQVAHVTAAAAVRSASASTVVTTVCSPDTSLARTEFAVPVSDSLPAQLSEPPLRSDSLPPHPQFSERPFASYGHDGDIDADGDSDGAPRVRPFNDSQVDEDDEVVPDVAPAFDSVPSTAAGASMAMGEAGEGAVGDDGMGVEAGVAEHEGDVAMGGLGHIAAALVQQSSPPSEGPESPGGEEIPLLPLPALPLPPVAAAAPAASAAAPAPATAAPSAAPAEAKRGRASVLEMLTGGAAKRLPARAGASAVATVLETAPATASKETHAAVETTIVVEDSQPPVAAPPVTTACEPSLIAAASTATAPAGPTASQASQPIEGTLGLSPITQLEGHVVESQAHGLLASASAAAASAAAASVARADDAALFSPAVSSVTEAPAALPSASAKSGATTTAPSITVAKAPGLPALGTRAAGNASPAPAARKRPLSPPPPLSVDTSPSSSVRSSRSASLASSASAFRACASRLGLLGSFPQPPSNFRVLASQQPANSPCEDRYFVAYDGDAAPASEPESGLQSSSSRGGAAAPSGSGYDDGEAARDGFPSGRSRSSNCGAAGPAAPVPSAFLVGVADGHGGESAADFVREHLPTYVFRFTRDAATPAGIVLGLQRAFKKCDDVFIHSVVAARAKAVERMTQGTQGTQRSRRDKAEDVAKHGCCVSAVLVRRVGGQWLSFSVNAGDSRSVVGRYVPPPATSGLTAGGAASRGINGFGGESHGEYSNDSVRSAASIGLAAAPSEDAECGPKTTTAARTEPYVAPIYCHRLAKAVGAIALLATLVGGKTPLLSAAAGDAPGVVSLLDTVPVESVSAAPLGDEPSWLQGSDAAAPALSPGAQASARVSPSFRASALRWAADTVSAAVTAQSAAASAAPEADGQDSRPTKRTKRVSSGGSLASLAPPPVPPAAHAPAASAALTTLIDARWATLAGSPVPALPAGITTTGALPSSSTRHARPRAACGAALSADHDLGNPSEVAYLLKRCSDPEAIRIKGNPQPVMMPLPGSRGIITASSNASLASQPGHAREVDVSPLVAAAVARFKAEHGIVQPAPPPSATQSGGAGASARARAAALAAESQSQSQSQSYSQVGGTFRSQAIEQLATPASITDSFCRSLHGETMPIPPQFMPRIGGSLQISRVIGDAYLKHRDFAPPLWAPYVPYVSAIPEVRVRALGSRDRFLILASDGLWDSLGVQRAVEVVCHALADEDTVATFAGFLDSSASAAPPGVQSSSAPQLPCGPSALESVGYGLEAMRCCRASGGSAATATASSTAGTAAGVSRQASLYAAPEGSLTARSMSFTAGAASQDPAACPLLSAGPGPRQGAPPAPKVSSAADCFLGDVAQRLVGLSLYTRWLSMVRQVLVHRASAGDAAAFAQIHLNGPERSPASAGASGASSTSGVLGGGSSHNGISGPDAFERFLSDAPAGDRRRMYHDDITAVVTLLPSHLFAPEPDEAEGGMGATAASCPVLPLGVTLTFDEDAFHAAVAAEARGAPLPVPSPTYHPTYHNAQRVAAAFPDQARVGPPPPPALDRAASHGHAPAPAPVPHAAAEAARQGSDAGSESPEIPPLPLPRGERLASSVQLQPAPRAIFARAPATAQTAPAEPVQAESVPTAPAPDPAESAWKGAALKPSQPQPKQRDDPQSGTVMAAFLRGSSSAPAQGSAKLPGPALPLPVAASGSKPVGSAATVASDSSRSSAGARQASGPSQGSGPSQASGGKVTSSYVLPSAGGRLGSAFSGAQSVSSFSRYSAHSGGVGPVKAGAPSVSAAMRQPIGSQRAANIAFAGAAAALSGSARLGPGMSSSSSSAYLQPSTAPSAAAAAAAVPSAASSFSGTVRSAVSGASRPAAGATSSAPPALTTAQPLVSMSAALGDYSRRPGGVPSVASHLAGFRGPTAGVPVGAGSGSAAVDDIVEDDDEGGAAPGTRASAAASRRVPIGSVVASLQQSRSGGMLALAANGTFLPGQRGIGALGQGIPSRASTATSLLLSGAGAPNGQR